jgi:enamine deaminase RidA (YjgF/YER057c/UK114 family)
MVTFRNPASVHTPVGSYVHTAVVPGGSKLVFISGQVGMRRNGTVPATLAEQADVVFDNLRGCLAEHGLGMESIVKLTSYLVSGQDMKAMREVRQRHLGAHKPTSTAVFVPALVSPEYLLEVEAVAVAAQ